MNLQRLKIIVVLCICIFTCQRNSNAQTLKNKWLGMNAGMGTMLLPGYVFKDNTTRLDDRIPYAHIGMMWELKNKEQAWAKRLNAQYQSINLSFREQSDLDAEYDTLPNTFGNAISINYHLHILLLGNEKHQFQILPGVGFTYDTKTYYNDNRNIYIGSHLNFLATAELGYLYFVSEKLLFNIQAGFFHYSNGAMILPNRGINSLNTSIGFKCKI